MSADNTCECGRHKEWRECGNCHGEGSYEVEDDGGGVTEFLDRDCDQCAAKGGWFKCMHCNPWEEP